jgi:cytochrome c553
MRQFAALLAMAATAATSTTTASAAPAAPDHARQLAQACVACHGATGNSADPLRYPNLAAQAPAYLALQLKNFRSGERPNPVMRAIAQALSPADMQALGQYFGAQAAQPQASRYPAQEQMGRRIYEQGGAGAPACAGCHGPQGHGQSGYPRIASQPAPYLLEQLRVYRDVPHFGNPLATMMKGVAVRLKEGEMQAVAAYLATLP